jgi:hypothetical protein
MVMRGLDQYGFGECDYISSRAYWNDLRLSESQLTFFFFAGGGDSEGCADGDQRAWENGILSPLLIGASEPEGGLDRGSDFDLSLRDFSAEGSAAEDSVCGGGEQLALGIDADTEKPSFWDHRVFLHHHHTPE